MTKKHFIALADKIKAIKPNMAILSGELMVIALADFCQEQNPRFNRERWIDYINGKCGKNGGKV